VSKASGFLQLRRGVWEHIKDGRMSHMDAIAFIYITSQADTRTGVWNGSASALAGELSLSPRNARRLVERLSEGNYVRRFPVPGRHVCYPILINKFLVTDGEHKGEHLNALESTSPADLRYVRSEQECEQTGEHKGEHSASQMRIENREKNPHRKKRDADPRFKPILDLYYERTRKLGIEPGCDKSDFGKLRIWLSSNPNRTLEGILASVANAFASTDPYPLKPGFRLREFLAHESKYQRGPLLKSAPRTLHNQSLFPFLQPQRTKANVELQNTELWGRKRHDRPPQITDGPTSRTGIAWDLHCKSSVGTARS